MDNKWVKYILIAGGIYLLYRYWQSTQAPPIVATPPSPGTQPAITDGTTTVKPAVELTTPAPGSVVTGQQLGTYARGFLGNSWDGLLTSDEWSYYLGQWYGQPVAPTADLFPAGNREYRMNADEYVRRRQEAGGFNGLGSLPQVARLAAAFGGGVSGWTM